MDRDNAQRDLVPSRRRPLQQVRCEAVPAPGDSIGTGRVHLLALLAAPPAAARGSDLAGGE